MDTAIRHDLRVASSLRPIPRGDGLRTQKNYNGTTTDYYYSGSVRCILQQYSCCRYAHFILLHKVTYETPN